MKKLFLVLICGSLMGFSACLGNAQAFLQQVDEIVHGDEGCTITREGLDCSFLGN